MRRFRSSPGLPEGELSSFLRRCAEYGGDVHNAGVSSGSGPWFYQRIEPLPSAALPSVRSVPAACVIQPALTSACFSRISGAVPVKPYYSRETEKLPGRRASSILPRVQHPPARCRRRRGRPYVRTVRTDDAAVPVYGDPADVIAAGEQALCRRAP